MITPDDLDPEIRQSYVQFKQLPDGRLCGVLRLMFHWTIHVDIDHCGYADKYCYQTLPGALVALIEWDGTGDPDGWHRHFKTGRRRDLKTGEEWIAW